MKQINRFVPKTENSFFLFGPRGTGKTIWTQQEFPHSLWIDLLSPKVLSRYINSPDYLREKILAEITNESKPPFSVVIDEIQKVPELLDVVHSMIVAFPQIQFILTGSSARKIKRQEVNLLGGRAILRNMHPFLASEMGDIFDFNKCLQVGMLPVVWGARQLQETLDSYVQVYLEEEVKHEGLVRNSTLFSRFLQMASFSHGSVPNMASIARECGSSANGVKSFFEILEDLLLCFFLPIFTKRAKRILVSRAKFYYFDVGVYRSLRPKAILDMPAEIDGLALEGFIAQHLRAWCDYSAGKHKLYYWRTKSGVEVDFVLYGESGIFAYEVKNTDHIKQEHLRHLKAFGEDYPEAKLTFLYRGQEALMKGNILCLPCEQFLRKLVPNEGL